MTNNQQLAEAFRAAYEDILDESPLAPDWERATGQVVSLQEKSSSPRIMHVLAGTAAVVVFAVASLSAYVIFMRSADNSPAAVITVTTEGTAQTTLPPTTTVPTTTSVPTTTAVPVTPVRLEMTWEQVSTQSAFGLDDVISSVIEGGPGLVAVGGAMNAGNADAAVWTSADGVTWDRIAGPDVLGVTVGYQMIMDVANGPMGLVAVGWVDTKFGDLDPPIWVSPDGLTWSRLTGNADAFSPGSLINAITTGGPGFVAVGISDVGSAAIWVSGDGKSWTRVEQPLGDGYTDSQITDILATDSGLVAVGFADPEWQHFATGRVLAWTSQDGLTWDRSDLGSETGTVWAVAGTGDTAIAVGNTSDDSAAWISSDAKTWSPPSPIVTLAEELWFWDAVWDGDRLLVVGVWFPELRSGEPPFPGLSGPVAWASDDAGTTWHEIPISNKSDEGLFASTVDQRPSGFRDVIAFGDRFLAVGGTGNGSAPVWIGTWNEE